MIIEVRKLNTQKKYSGVFSYGYNAPKSLIAVPTFDFADAVKVEGDYLINEDDSLELRFKVKFKLKGSCSYCLEPAEAEIEFEYEALFSPYDEEVDYYSYNGITADITPAVNDAILFSQPSVILCKEGCKGIDLK